jgi:hypothetical protein
MKWMNNKLRKFATLFFVNLTNGRVGNFNFWEKELNKQKKGRKGVFSKVENP